MTTLPRLNLMKGYCSRQNFSTSFLVVILLLSLSFPLHFFVEAINPSDYQQTVTLENTEATNFLRPIIRREESMDRNLNGVQDSLENMIFENLKNETAFLPIVVTLSSPVEKQDIDWFQMYGGSLTNVYQYVTYGFAGTLPIANISLFASSILNRLTIIEFDSPLRYHLDVSAPLIRARPIVWDTYGYRGFPDKSIAILDTGIDDSHVDLGPFQDLNFSKKMVGWYDATSDKVSTPQDYGEHGTHVAGIAAGTGAANTLQGSGDIETTFTYVLPTAGYGYIDFIDIKTPGLIQLSCSWGGRNTVLLRIYNPAGSSVAQTIGSSQPLILTYNTQGTSYPTGRYRVLVGNWNGPKGTPFSVLETYPYQGQNDGHNLFSGVAPDSRLVGVKVFDNTGSGTLSTLIQAMDWIIANKNTYRIVVVNMSLSLENGGTDTTLDQKADTLVQNGIVTTVSAGNDYPDFTIGSPGTAAYVITVGATNDQNGVTSYSSNGDSLKNEYGLTKPDVVAPGGTFDPAYGNKIVSADSNDLDALYSDLSDQNLNDYQQMAGTSMSAPHVAGLSALVIQALGGWTWTQQEALKVKMIISMTAYETQSGESSNVPPLNRGEKDNREGYGRVSADAAIEAASMTYNIEDVATETLGSGYESKKVWARRVSLLANGKYEFRLSVPSAADYDLYLYSGNPDSYGQPVILAKSTNASTGGLEEIQYTAISSGLNYIVVKWVSGNGAFTLQSERTLPHDIAVLNVTTSATSAYVGEIVNITVLVKNKGESSETFEVTAYFNESVIETQTVSNLVAGMEKNVTIRWNTTNVTPCHNYRIWAEASVVQGEIDFANNQFIDGYIKIKTILVGDVNLDGVVDITDLATVGRSYGAKIGDSRYAPERDINHDGFINIIDLALIGVNFGKSCT